ncbi:uncharacterized protein TNIN_438001 [Trichonephila inaurata madagascariensis]|uniref:Uncharacterized protein n=1 Tax=Trichonephila inaurata madagascariensis TaxID=2747483 RepID=A0A8X6XDR2_9ARAC|nr:uncharacterized protein TNIN_438001 [Trichonephila inaurata madagascariensis]
MRSLVMTGFAWPGLWSPMEHTLTHTLTACKKASTPFSERLVRDTFLPVNGHHPPMNSCRFLTFHCQKLDNTSLLLNHRILQRERHPVLIRTAASFGRRFL